MHKDIKKELELEKLDTINLKKKSDDQDLLIKQLKGHNPEGNLNRNVLHGDDAHKLLPENTKKSKDN